MESLAARFGYDGSSVVATDVVKKREASHRCREQQQWVLQQRWWRRIDRALGLDRCARLVASVLLNTLKRSSSAMRGSVYHVAGIVEACESGARSS